MVTNRMNGDQNVKSILKNREKIMITETRIGPVGMKKKRMI